MVGNKHNKAKNEHIEVTLDGVQTVKQINVHFQREDDAGQNIKKFKVEIKNEQDQYEEVYKNSTDRAKQLETITLPEAKKAKAVKVTILDADGGKINWVNVGIREIEVYAQDIEATENKNHMLTAKMKQHLHRKQMIWVLINLKMEKQVNKTVGQVRHTHMKISGLKQNLQNRQWLKK